MGKCLVFSLWLARTTSPSNPASPVTWYQRVRHSSAGKAIPCSRSVFWASPLFFHSFILQLLSFFIVALHFSPFFILALSLSFPSSSLSLPCHCPPSCPTNMAVFGFVGRGWSSEGAEIITMVIHIKTGQKGKGGSVLTHWQGCYYSYNRRSWKSLMLI